jgi:predicted transcriptional regulator
MNAIFSIKPAFVQKILSGEKRYEFRKRIFKNQNVSRIVIYATQPVGAIVGEFTIDDILRDAPDQLWQRTEKHAGVSKQFYDSYFQGHTSAVAIKIGAVREYRSVLDPNLLFDRFTAPQSFTYLSDSEYAETLGGHA